MSVSVGFGPWFYPVCSNPLPPLLLVPTVGPGSHWRAPLPEGARPFPLLPHSLAQELFLGGQWRGCSEAPVTVLTPREQLPSSRRAGRRGSVTPVGRTLARGGMLCSQWVGVTGLSRASLDNDHPKNWLRQERAIGVVKSKVFREPHRIYSTHYRGETGSGGEPADTTVTRSSVSIPVVAHRCLPPAAVPGEVDAFAEACASAPAMGGPFPPLAWCQAVALPLMALIPQEGGRSLEPAALGRP